MPASEAGLCAGGLELTFQKGTIPVRMHKKTWPPGLESSTKHLQNAEPRQEAAELVKVVTLLVCHPGNF